MRTAAILPVKSFIRAKRRLGASVDGALRDELAQAMVGDVLVALSQTASIERTILVTREDSVAEAARRLGALVVQDTAEEGQSAAVSLGVAAAIAEGFERVLCIPGDCPALDPAELDTLLEGSTAEVASDPAELDALPDAANRDELPAEHAAVTIVPDRHGTGTNGLLLAPPDVVSPSFGPGSCARHRALARTSGAVCRIEQPGSLLLDIDTGEDLAVLRERLSAEQTRAPRTRAVLDRSQEPCLASPPAA